ncbi:MAG TPA: hypothetical protein VHO25_14670 [Polyangiaceae bacterium]|nr:hypothetical protein [Polyangiaceae bacterium]
MNEPRVRAGSLPKRWSLVVALGVPVLVLLGIALGYYRLVYFERVAALHVPAAAHFAARIDVEQVVLFEPIRKNLLPALDEASVVNGNPLSQRIAAETGINLAMDLREIVVALGPDEQWVVVLGGLFPKQGLEGVVRAITQDERLASSSISQGVLRLEPWALVAAQAADGSFVISNQQQALLAALSPNETFRSLGLSREGAGSVATVFSESAPSPLKALARARAELGLGPTITLRVEAEPSLAALTRGDDAERWLTGAKLLAAGDGPWRALRPGLARAERLSSAQNHWVFQSFLERHEVDTWFADLAAQLRSRLQLPVPPAR